MGMCCGFSIKRGRCISSLVMVEPVSNWSQILQRRCLKVMVCSGLLNRSSWWPVVEDSSILNHSLSLGKRKSCDRRSLIIFPHGRQTFKPHCSMHALFGRLMALQHVSQSFQGRCWVIPVRTRLTFKPSPCPKSALTCILVEHVACLTISQSFGRMRWIVCMRGRLVLEGNLLHRFDQGSLDVVCSSGKLQVCQGWCLKVFMCARQPGPFCLHKMWLAKETLTTQTRVCHANQPKACQVTNCPARRLSWKPSFAARRPHVSSHVIALPPSTAICRHSLAVATRLAREVV